MKAKMAVCCAALSVLLALAGCVQLVAEGNVNSGELTESEGAGQSTSEGQEQTITADDDIMDSMTCEFLDVSGSDELITMFGHFDLAVSVEVGESNSKTWWVVVFEWDDDDGVVDLRDAYLTDTLGQASYCHGTWIRLHGSDPWYGVGWDHDMLVRGQSALELAIETLAD